MPENIKVLNFKFSSDEFEWLREQGAEYGLSASQWGKIKMLYWGENSLFNFQELLKLAQQRLEVMPVDLKATIKKALVYEWEALPRTLKLNLGVALKHAVDHNKVRGIIPTTCERSDRNSQWYIKIEEEITHE